MQRDSIQQEIEIVLPRHLARDYGQEIAAVAPDRVRLLAITGGGPGDPDVARAEIALNGIFDGALDFADIVTQMPALRWIHSTSSGIDDFVSPALAERGCLVTNSAGLFSPAIAEYTIAAMVLLGRDLPRWFALQREHRWGDVLAVPNIMELRGRRLGIVGYGAIGRYLAAACKQLGMEVWATKRTPMPTVGEPLDRLLPADDLHELLGACDAIVLAASLTASSRRLIGAAELHAMRPGAILVNVGRGALLDEDALVAALAGGRLRGAMLDVTTREPLPADSPLWDAPNLWLTPHVAGCSDEGWDRTIELFCANLRQYAAGRPHAMGNLVDLDDHL
jgi:phosphoglycerate dehydrogenase-like enzyme